MVLSTYTLTFDLAVFFAGQSHTVHSHVFKHLCSYCHQWHNLKTCLHICKSLTTSASVCFRQSAETFVRLSEHKHLLSTPSKFIDDTNPHRQDSSQGHSLKFLEVLPTEYGSRPPGSHFQRASPDGCWASLLMLRQRRQCRGPYISVTPRLV